jgi:hypothetical protein
MKWSVLKLCHYIALNWLWVKNMSDEKNMCAMMDWALVRDANHGRLWDTAWVDLVYHYEVVLRLSPVSRMPTMFVANRDGELYLGWWQWGNKPLSEVGLEETDLVDYFGCCRVEPCGLEDTPFYNDPEFGGWHR